VQDSPNLAARTSDVRLPACLKSQGLISHLVRGEKRLPPPSSLARSAKALYTNLTLCQHTRELANKMQKRTEEPERDAMPPASPRGKIDY
jgi:hypothetical protein